MRFKLSQFFCWDLATGAKIIGSLGVLKHSLAILVIYLATIDVWVLSNEKEEENKIPTLAFTFIVLLLFIGLVVNVISIVLSYRLFKILDTNQIQDLTSWINAERVYFTLFTIYFFIKLSYGEFDFKHLAPVLSFAFDVYCYLCVMSLREDYRQRSSLLSTA